MVLRFLPPVVVCNGHALDIANAYILLQSITCSAEINTLWVVFYANHPQGNTDREKGQCVEAVTMYIYIYLFTMCAVNEPMPKGPKLYSVFLWERISC